MSIYYKHYLSDRKSFAGSNIVSSYWSSLFRGLANQFWSNSRKLAGPILFITFINNIVEVIKSLSIHLFVDDLTISINIKIHLIQIFYKKTYTMLNRDFIDSFCLQISKNLLISTLVIDILAGNIYSAA